MVRFARIKGVHAKSSFNKVPEEASTWEDLMRPTTTDVDERSKPAEDVKTKSLPKKVEGVWSEFEPEMTNKKKKKKSSESELEPGPKKKKSKGESTSEQTDAGEANKNAEAPKVSEKRAKKLQQLKERLREQGQDENDIFGLNDLDKDSTDSKQSWNFETEAPKLKKKKTLNVHSDSAPHIDEKASNAQVPPKKKTRKEKELEGVDFKRRKPESVETVFCTDGQEIKLEKFDGYLVSEERAKRLRELRQRLRDEGKDEKDIFGIVKSERRKAEKELKSLKKRMCFHCRKGGHNISDCPELDKKPEQGTGICFKCGSTEHMLSQCKSKSTTLEYATCFICNQKGHLSKNCTNNPRGLYPDGGGCKTCGDVTHYERDCPKKRKSKEVISAKRIVFDDVEALDYDEVSPPKKPLKINVAGKQPNRIIKF